MPNQTFLKISIIIQILGIFGIIAGAYYFATMSSTNMRGIFFLIFWGIPSIIQVFFILIGLFSIKINNLISKLRKFYLFVIFLYVPLFLFVIIPILKTMFPYEITNYPKLNGIGEYILYFFFVLPYFGYLFLCLKSNLKTQISQDLFQKLQD